ncbi:MAG: M28 family peptidase [Cyclobacteriaceae bacterium]|nr:M28 family peptidase [Cyclobacteriaceae bacterium]
MRKRSVLIVLISLVVTALQAQSLYNEDALMANLKFLSSDSLQGRKTGTPENAVARAFVQKQFKQLGLLPFDTGYDFPFEFDSRTGEKIKGVNVAGWIKGKKDSYIVISAHYDHVGVRNDKIYNGADDNASGTSALFAIAEYFSKHKPEHNIIIVAFDAEEMGLRGASAFVANPPVAVEKILVNLNMDMVARADKGELVACGTFYYPQLKPYLEGISSEKVKLVFGHDDPEKYKGQDNWTFSSDHGPFHRVKIPFVYFGVEDHKDYHQPTDDFELVNPDIYKECVRLIIQAASRIDKGLK